MAAADTAKLIAQLTLDDKGFSRGIDKSIAKAGQLESTLGNVGRRAGAGLQTLGKNLAIGAAIGVGALTVAVKGGLDNLAQLENAITSVDGSIAQLGLTGQLTGKQVADWANEIERDVDAAFDDKAITQAATTLLRFGRVTPKALKQALTVTTDLAAKTGDVESASVALAKALADPAKAAGKLAKQGVVLTKAQQDTIKAMVKQNDIAGAQQLILDAVATSTGGAAKAMAGPYQDAINKTNDAIEDAQKALAVGFLPVITKVADKLSTIAADPQALASIKAFGETLAGGLEDLISLAERLPWNSIGASLQLAGAGAKAVLQAFTSLPPWVQTAVLTGWGLNKLTGGALTGIVGELGKGLIKGVLGIQAAQVNITAANVTGAGGVPGAAGGKGGGGLLGAVGAITIAGFTLAAANEIGNAIVNATGGPTGGAGREISPGIIIGQSQAAAARGIQPVKDKDVQAEIEKSARESAVRNNASNERLEAIKAEQARTGLKIAEKIAPVRSEMIRVREEYVRSAGAISSKIQSTNSELQLARISAAQNAASQKATTAAGLADVRGAIQRKNFAPKVSVTVNNQLSISVRDQIKQRKLFHSVFHHAE